VPASGNPHGALADVGAHVGYLAPGPKMWVWLAGRAAQFEFGVRVSGSEPGTVGFCHHFLQGLKFNRCWVLLFRNAGLLDHLGPLGDVRDQSRFHSSGEPARASMPEIEQLLLLTSGNATLAQAGV